MKRPEIHNSPGSGTQGSLFKIVEKIELTDEELSAIGASVSFSDIRKSGHKALEIRFGKSFFGQPEQRGCVYIYMYIYIQTCLHICICLIVCIHIYCMFAIKGNISNKRINQLIIQMFKGSVSRILRWVYQLKGLFKENI